MDHINTSFTLGLQGDPDIEKHPLGIGRKKKVKSGSKNPLAPSLVGQLKGVLTSNKGSTVHKATLDFHNQSLPCPQAKG